MTVSTRSSDRFDVGLLLMRIMLGVVFVYHGSMKLFGWFAGGGLAGMAEFNAQLGLPFPMAGALFAGAAEFFGGLALLAGFAVQWAVIPMIVTMLVASFAVHGGAFWLENDGMEYTLTLAVFLAAQGVMGPGRLTIGRFLRANDTGRTTP